MKNLVYLTGTHWLQKKKHFLVSFCPLEVRYRTLARRKLPNKWPSLFSGRESPKIPDVSKDQESAKSLTYEYSGGAGRESSKEPRKAEWGQKRPEKAKKGLQECKIRRGQEVILYAPFWPRVSSSFSFFCALSMLWMVWVTLILGGYLSRVSNDLDLHKCVYWSYF